MKSQFFHLPEIPESKEPWPIGGVDTGRFEYTAEGFVSSWSLDDPAVKGPVVPHNAFHIWMECGRSAQACTLQCDSRFGIWPQPAPIPAVAYHFPIGLCRYALAGWPIDLETVSFSPILPGHPGPSCFPIWVYRVGVANRSGLPMKMGVLLTWAFATDKIVSPGDFDIQHDNLCVSAILRDRQSDNRMVIALPDIHHRERAWQGAEPWDPDTESAEIWKDFADDGEIESRWVSSDRQAAALWVKFELEADEVRSFPFFVTWHFPKRYDKGGRLVDRQYMRYPTKRRPDNAVVWLAEQARLNNVEWLSRISDWLNPEVSYPDLPPYNERAEMMQALYQEIRAE